MTASTRRARRPLRLFLLLLSSASVVVTARGQYATVALDTLTLPKAVELATSYHPSLRSAEASVQSAAGAYRQAFAGYLPTVSFSTSASHTQGVFVFNPSSPPPYQDYNTFTALLSAQQTVFDFGRTIGRVSAGTDFEDASKLDQAATRNTVISNVEIAFYSVTQAAAVVRVNEEAVDAAQRHLVQARGFYLVGRRPQLDVTKAEVDLANANVNLITARNGLQVARVQLENTIGVRIPASVVIKDTFDVELTVPPLDSMRNIGMANRPELLAARARVSGSSSLTTATISQHLPIFSAGGTYQWSDFKLSPLYPRWNVGLTFTLPVFQGFAIDAQVQQARANEEIARATLTQLEQGAILEIDQNYLAVKEAQERVWATVKLVQQAEQALILAERQYAAGVGTQLDVTDAQLTRSNARITRIQALFDLNSSFVRLRRSIGTLP